ncbi:MAG: hypothetical protein VCF08_22500, partial [Alphaproteobacteria bacterium]
DEVIGREETSVADRLRELSEDKGDRRILRLGRWQQRTNRRLPDGSLIILTEGIHDMIPAEKQLNQAQKIEAVGQLTGAIAQNFNNFLAVMLGHLELAADGLPENSDVTPMLDKAITAANRGADLIRRLLTFSAKRALSPKLSTSING